MAKEKVGRGIGAFFAAATGGLLAVLLVSCNGSNTAEGDSSTDALEVDQYAMNVVVSGVPFWEDSKRIWSAIDISEPDVELSFGGPLDTNAQEQIEQLQALKAGDIDGLVIAPADSSALNTTIDELVASGVPVVTFLVDAPESDRLAYVTSELAESSARIADAVLDDDPRGQKAIIIFAESGNEEQETRAQGFRDFLAAQGVEIVGEVTDGYDEAKSAEDIKAILTREPGVRYIFGSHSRAAVGAVTAVREQGIEIGAVKITGWDTDADVIDLIIEGWVEATAAQNSAFMVQTAFQILEAHTGNFVYPDNRSYENSGIEVIPEVITVPVTIVTDRNAPGFRPK